MVLSRLKTQRLALCSGTTPLHLSFPIFAKRLPVSRLGRHIRRRNLEPAQDPFIRLFDPFSAPINSQCHVGLP